MSRSIRLIAETALLLAVLATAGVVFGTAKAKLDSDEAEWIGTTRYFQRYFVDHDVSAASWPDEYWTRTQPMVVRYVIGSWLWLRGYDLESLDPTYDYTRNLNVNRRAGLGPSDELLAEARIPTRALAALAIGLLYLVVRVLAGPIGGLVAAVLATGSPYLQEHLVRAKAESTLMALLLGALLVGVIATRGRCQHRPGLRSGIALGVLLGLAFGAKLTAILAILAVVLWGAWACLAEGLPLSRLRERGLGGEGRSRPWLWPSVALVTCGLVFLVSNPFLWPDPIGRTWLLFDNRREEMARQQVNVPSRAVYTLDRRATLVWDRSVSNDAFGPSRLNWPIEAWLAVVGAGWLALRAVSRQPTALGLVFLWTACIWIGVTVGLGFLLQHYFVPTALMADLLAGLGAGWAMQTAWRLTRRHLPLRRGVGAEVPVATSAAPPAQTLAGGG